MNERLYEALEVCLNALETGADIEAVLNLYPQFADELRPILETSIQARSLADFALQLTGASVSRPVKAGKRLFLQEKSYKV